jgi:hypothetical protein
MLVVALLVGLGVAVFGVYSLVDRPGGKSWFFWFAPLLVLQITGILLLLATQYWSKVGKLEVKGRPKR